MKPSIIRAAASIYVLTLRAIGIAAVASIFAYFLYFYYQAFGALFLIAGAIGIGIAIGIVLYVEAVTYLDKNPK